MVPRPGAGAVPVELAPRPIGGAPMTEAEWLSATDCRPLIAFLREAPNWRKMRLAGCGCGRRILPFLKDAWVSSLLVAAESAADNQCEQSNVDSILRVNQPLFDARLPESAQYQGIVGIVFAAAHHPNNRLFETAFWWMSGAAAWEQVPNAAITVDDWDTPHDPAWRAADVRERVAQLTLFRDIFGNPFRPVAFDPAWRTDTAVSLARGMYDSREFGAMPILADALQDAGCEDEQVLTLCSEPGPHVRGCWVCDLVLGL